MGAIAPRMPWSENRMRLALEINSSRQADVLLGASKLRLRSGKNARLARRWAASDAFLASALGQALTNAVIASVMAAAAAKIERIAEMAFMALSPVPAQWRPFGRTCIRRDKLAHRL
ncbi:MAG: hypothetical protein AB7U86_16255 [Methylocystis sp.]|uniref:hypothetical protein n=1 Tax=Methylocystis sp. TaxID=1911079 RepID=UPI003D12F967